MALTTCPRSGREIAHGRSLAQHDPEAIWGWSTPAGKRRAQRRAALISRGADLTPTSRALELGCGTGMFTEMFAQSGARLIAVDLSPELLDRARRRRLPVRQVSFVEGRFETCTVDGSFDAVIGSSVLHHLDVEPSLRKIHALLRPGGLLSFAEPNLLNPQVFLERRLHFLPCFSYVSPDETAFIRWPLRRLLERTGFTEISLTPFDWLHPRTPPSLINLVNRAGRVLERALAVREFAGSLYIRARRP